jgi:hypothetical protein
MPLLFLIILINLASIHAFTTTPFLPHTTFSKSSISYTALSEEDVDLHPNEQQDRVNIVLVTGFESFNRDLYERAGWLLPHEMGVNLQGWFGLLFVVPYSSYKDIQHFVYCHLTSTKQTKKYLPIPTFEPPPPSLRPYAMPIFSSARSSSITTMS